MRLGVPEELTGPAGGVEPGVRECFERILALAEGLGAIVEPCRLPHAPHALSAYYIIAPAEASANLARFDGVRYGLRVGGDEDLTTMYSRTRAAGFGAEVKRRIMLGTYALSSGYYDAYYGTRPEGPHEDRRGLPRRVRPVRLHRDADEPGTAFELGAKSDDPLAMYLNDFCTVPMSLAGIPAISIPVRAQRGLAGRPPARRTGVQRERDARCRVRTRAGDRLRRHPGAQRGSDMSAADRTSR